MTNAFKVPRASEVTIIETPKPQQARRLPASAPVTVCMYKYTDDAGDVSQRSNFCFVVVLRVLSHSSRVN